MYELVFSRDVLEELAAIESMIERRKVLAAIQCLTADPQHTGLAEIIDAEGRINRLAVLGSSAFVFWADHSMRKLRILAVRGAGSQT